MGEVIVPSRGLCFIRRVETDNRMGSIYAPDDTVDKYTAQQFEIVSLGSPQLFEEIPDRLFNKEWSTTTRRGVSYYYRDVEFSVDDWILIQPRTALPTGVRGIYAITYDNIMGRFVEC